MTTRKGTGAGKKSPGAKGRKDVSERAAPSKRSGESGARGKAAAKPAPKSARHPATRGASDRTVSARAAYRRRRKPESLRLRTVTPSLTVDDLERSIDFYSRVLGFVVGERWVVEGELRGVMLQAGKCSIGLSQDDWAKGRRRKKGQGVRIWLETAQDLDGIAERIWAAGVQAEGPKVEEWGTRTLGVIDPDGYQITLTELETR